MMATLGELSVTISLYQIIIDRPTNQLTDGHEIAFNHVFNQPGGESCIAAKKNGYPLSFLAVIRRWADIQISASVLLYGFVLQRK